MNALLTILVAALFSFWVWTLKHQHVHTPRPAVPAGPVGPHGPTHLEPAESPARLSPRQGTSQRPTGFNGRNTDGVLVWTIDG